jgi:hypothetical protein
MSALEKHYTVQDLEEMWSCSGNTIRRGLRDILGPELPGVVKLGHLETRNCRKWVMLKIPESMANRLYVYLAGPMAGRSSDTTRSVCRRSSSRARRVRAADEGKEQTYCSAHTPLGDCPPVV